ncbi:MAG: bifunctional methylenetetrahydrofolate dehydrogenase/methenyltetrahydrofolate cyclohydrolase FolD [SAR324 cluster bacterium]|nr:bifunctional methylenetetrahydrofolate dehydrogenase/methenyltetrahydrofolate cyclohydrolase FolD [SAR324 cluster bacterium]
MPQIISGKEIGAQIRSELKQEVTRLKEQGLAPCLAVVLVGDDPASAIYVRNKKQACEELGIVSVEHRLPGTTSQVDLEALIQSLNKNPNVHGILCQFPLPKPLNDENVILTIHPDKDVDGLHPLNAGYLAMGKPKFISCTPLGVYQLLKRSQVNVSGKHAVIIGRSNLVGRPLSNLLSQKGCDATVTVCHSRTKNLAELTKQADILIAAIGQPEFVTPEMVGEGAVVIDVGMNRVIEPDLPKGSRLCGDVLYDAVFPKVSAITPVPGGVGPMTIAMLMYNTINAARWQSGLPAFDL